MSSFDFSRRRDMASEYSIDVVCYPNSSNRCFFFTTQIDNLNLSKPNKSVFLNNTPAYDVLITSSPIGQGKEAEDLTRVTSWMERHFWIVTQDPPSK